MRRGPEAVEVLVIGGGLALLAALLLPVLAVAAPLAVGLLLVHKPWAAGVLLAAFVAPFVWFDPLAVAQAYVGLQLATGTAMLDTHALPALLPYLAAVAPFAVLLGLPCGAAGAVLLPVLASLRSKGEPSGSTEPSAPSKLVFADAHALAQTETRPVVWAVPDVLGRGVLTLLSAPPKAGKSVWTWAAVKAMQSGGHFFGLRTAPQRVLWLTEEGQSFAATARAFGVPPGAVDVLHRADVQGWDWPALVRQVRRRAWQQRCGLVVIDTIRAWAPQAEQTPEHANAMANVLRRELTGPGLGVLLLHHARKGGGEYGEGVAGTNALVGVVDVLVELARVPGDERARRMTTTGRFAPLDAVATLRDGRYRLAVKDGAEPEDDAAAEPAVPAHLATMQATIGASGTVGLTAAAVRAALGISQTATYARLAGLEQRGLLRRTGGGTKTDPYRYVAADAVAPTPPLAPDEYDAYLKGAHWRKRSLEVLTRAGGTCERCTSAAATAVHHLDYSALGAEPDAHLIALCPACHGIVHSRQEQAA